MGRIKLIAFDLDGTILEEGLVIPEETRNVLEEALELGIKITTASGRKLEDQYKILQSNDMGDSKGWPHSLIVNESQIYFLNREDYEPFEAWNNKVHQEWIKVYPKAREIALEEITRLQGEGINTQLYIIDEDAIARNIVGIRFENVEDVGMFEEYLSKRLLNNEDGLWCNRNHRLVQILPKIAGKGSTVSNLARYLGIKPQEVIVIGDAGNDLDMIDSYYGFYPATVSNAEPRVMEAVKKNGGYIASQPISKGVAEIVNTLVLNHRI